MEEVEDHYDVRCSAKQLSPSELIYPVGDEQTW